MPVSTRSPVLEYMEKLRQNIEVPTVAEGDPWLTSLGEPIERE
jgi:hypothetical protein